MPAAGGNHPIEHPVRRAALKIGTTTATQGLAERALNHGRFHITIYEPGMLRPLLAQFISAAREALDDDGTMPDIER